MDYRWLVTIEQHKKNPKEKKKMKRKIISSLVVVCLFVTGSHINAAEVGKNDAESIFKFEYADETVVVVPSLFLENDEDKQVKSLFDIEEFGTRDDDEDEPALTAGVTAVLENSDMGIDEVAQIIELDDLEEIITDEEEPRVIDCSYKEVTPYLMYVGDTFLRARSEPATDIESNIVGVMKPGKVVEIIGERDDGWFVIHWKDQTCFVASEFLEIKKPVSATYNWTWTGAKLNSRAGIISGPSGNETYYNLNMSRVVSNMRSRGYNGEVWVREDGCKMFGDYIMCAANLAIHPRGSIVESSLGDCIVVDTGSFVKYDPTRLDIATTW